jgi:hypothetical protein
LSVGIEGRSARTSGHTQFLRTQGQSSTRLHEVTTHVTELEESTSKRQPHFIPNSEKKALSYVFEMALARDARSGQSAQRLSRQGYVFKQSRHGGGGRIHKIVGGSSGMHGPHQVSGPGDISQYSCHTTKKFGSIAGQEHGLPSSTKRPDHLGAHSASYGTHHPQPSAEVKN